MRGPDEPSEGEVLLTVARQEGENIRGLARIAEIDQEEHKERDELLDKRIAELISGIGAFIATQKKYSGHANVSVLA